MDSFELIFTIVIGAFVLLTIFSHKKLEIEKGKKPLYTSTGGGDIGGIGYKGPFINLRIYDEFIVIGCGRTMVLNYEEIISVEITQWLGLVAYRIQINHTNPNVPKRILIAVGNPAEVKGIIDARLSKQFTD